MNNKWNPSESTDKGEHKGLTNGASNVGEDQEAELSDKDWEGTVLTPRHFQEKFTYYTFANIHAMDPDSRDSDEIKSSDRTRWERSSTSVSGVSYDSSKGTHYHVRRSNKVSKSRSGRSRDRRSEGETQDITDRSTVSTRTNRSSHNPSLLEISEEVYAVRQAALTVMEPLTYGWVRSFPMVEHPVLNFIYFESF
jgi:hypothetical protein